MRLQPRHCRDILPLIPLDTLYVNHRFLFRLSLSSLRGCGFGFFLLRVFFRALLGIDGECGEPCCYRLCCSVSVRMPCLSQANVPQTKKSWWHLQSKASRAYPDDSAQAILCTSSLCRRTRNTRLAHQPVFLSWRLKPNVGPEWNTSGGREQTVEGRQC